MDLYPVFELRKGTRECVAVVGTRQATEYGIEATRRLTGELARAGAVIVSGLALGIDAVAHRTALDSHGTTVAVLGCGVDDATIGPRQNVPLARDILEHGGLLVSEYAPGTPADRWTFPARNRIISGLSRGVLVTEAAIKSGALITARLAADQGRDVFAVPGSIFWPRSQGPNHLIANGAKVAVNADDIIGEYGLVSGARNGTVSTQSDPVRRTIVAILENGPEHIDAIIAATDRTAPEIIATLSRMELEGALISTESGHYRIS